MKATDNRLTIRLKDGQKEAFYQKAKELDVKPASLLRNYINSLTQRK